MRSRVVLPLQAFGLGDIIFCMTIANRWYSEGYHVVWGVEPVYLPIAKHFPRIVFIDKSLLNIDYNITYTKTIGNATIVPIRWSDSIQRVPYREVMRAKYDMLNLDWREWKTGFWCDRDQDAENHLFYNILGLQDQESYNLISQQFQTGGRLNGHIEVNNGLRNVEMRFIDGYTLFDWLKVMQRATNIHAIASSNVYLFELYEMAAKEIHLYPRKPVEMDHANYEYILTKQYTLH